MKSLASPSNHKSPKILQGDCQEILGLLEPNNFQAIIADPPYFQVLLEENWDNQWQTEEDYLNWTEGWIRKAGYLLKTDGLFLSSDNSANANINRKNFIWKNSIFNFMTTYRYFINRHYWK